MGMSWQGERGDPKRDYADELTGLIDELAHCAEFSSATVPSPDVDPDEVTGMSGQAQENRNIRLSQARFVAERARLACDGLHELTTRARVLTEQLRTQRVLRQARLELTAAERSALADLWAVVPRLGRAPGPHSVVAELLGYACAIPGVSSAGLTIWDRRQAVVWTESSDEVARALSAVQSVTGGPGRDAAETGTPVQGSTPGSVDPAWERFRDAAVELGVRLVISVPIQEGNNVGSLDLYAREPDEFATPSRALAHLLGRYVVIALRILSGVSQSLRPSGLD